MKTTEVKTILLVELLKKEVERINELFNDLPKLKLELKYNAKELNQSLKDSFDHFTKILQNFIDANYWHYFDVKSFVQLDNNYLTETIEKNREILNGISKLLKLIK